MQILPIEPKNVSGEAQRQISKYMRLIAQCNETQALACDETVAILMRHGNTREAFTWELIAEQFRLTARQNFEHAFQMGIAP